MQLVREYTLLNISLNTWTCYKSDYLFQNCWVTEEKKPIDVFSLKKKQTKK